MATTQPLSLTMPPEVYLPKKKQFSHGSLESFLDTKDTPTNKVAESTDDLPAAVGEDPCIREYFSDELSSGDEGNGSHMHT